MSIKIYICNLCGFVEKEEILGLRRVYSLQLFLPKILFLMKQMVAPSIYVKVREQSITQIMLKINSVLLFTY